MSKLTFEKPKKKKIPQIDITELSTKCIWLILRFRLILKLRYQMRQYLEKYEKFCGQFERNKYFSEINRNGLVIPHKH